MSLDKVKKVQAFHFKAGQGAKTGTGGHLPGDKVKGKIAQVRELDASRLAETVSLAMSATDPVDPLSLLEQLDSAH